MSTKTTNYNLVKPDASEFYDVGVPNGNMDIIDQNLKSLNDGKQGNLTFDSTPTAGSSNPVTSGGTKTELDKKMTTATYDADGDGIVDKAEDVVLDQSTIDLYNTITGSSL